jgi:hypothetical protein
MPSRKESNNLLPRSLPPNYRKASCACQVLQFGGGSGWTFGAGSGSRARAAFERLALVSLVETLTPYRPAFVTLLSSVPAEDPC